MHNAVIVGLVILAFISSSIPSHARLGDSLEQCMARYGKPISHGKGDSTDAGVPWYAFKDGQYEREELIINGVVAIETIWKPDRSAFSEADKSAILESNSDNKKWGKPESVGDSVTWKRQDDSAAMYATATNQMTFVLHLDVRKR